MRKKKTKKIQEPREMMTTVVSFRLRDSEAAKLAKELKDDPIVGVKSLRQFARKLAVDYVNGRLVYPKKSDRDVSADVLAGMEKEEGKS